VGLTVSKDYLGGYADGLADAEASAARAERLRALAAIRRAAAIVRHLESNGWERLEANAVRWAIRAAIRSHKT